MSVPNQDIEKPFDTTGYAAISGAALAQLIDGAMPAPQKGMTIVTTDIAGNPEVPDAITETKYKRYVWIRQGAVAVSIYLWNDNGAVDVTFSKWVTAFQVAIGPASILGSMIAPNTITDNNIASVDWSKIVGAPGAIITGSAAGGDLTGTYPNPSVAALAITTAKIAANAVTGGAAGKMGTGANGATLADNIAIPAGSTYATPAGASAGAPAANDRVVVGVGAAGYATVRKTIDALAEPVAGDAFKIPRINSAGNGWEYVGDAVLQTLSEQTTGGASTTTVIPLDNSIPQVGEGAAFATIVITPKLASSVIKLTFSAMCDTSGNAAFVSIALFKDGAANAVWAGMTSCEDFARQINMEFYIASSVAGVAQSFELRFGPDDSSGAGTAYLNRDASGNVFGAACIASLTAQEIVATLS